MLGNQSVRVTTLLRVKPGCKKNTKIFNVNVLTLAITPTVDEVHKHDEVGGEMADERNVRRGGRGGEVTEVREVSDVVGGRGRRPRRL